MAIQSAQYKDSLKQQEENTQFLNEQRKLLRLQLKSFEAEKREPMRSSFIPKLAPPPRSTTSAGFANPAFSGVQTRSMRQNMVQSIPMQNLNPRVVIRPVAQPITQAPTVRQAPRVNWSSMRPRATLTRMQNFFRGIRRGGVEHQPLLEEHDAALNNVRLRQRVNTPSHFTRRAIRFLKKYKRPIGIGVATVATGGLIGALASIPKIVKAHAGSYGNDVVVDDDSAKIYGAGNKESVNYMGGGGGGGGGSGGGGGGNSVS